MGLALGFLIVVSLVLSAAVAFFVAYAGGSSPRWVLLVANEFVTMFMVSAVFLGLLRFVPSRRLPWRPLLSGAVTAGVLFELAKFAIAWYVADSAVVDAYGAAGSVVVLMLWVYYVAGIFLLGALVAREAMLSGTCSARPATTAASAAHESSR
jgi:membrane protein